MTVLAKSDELVRSAEELAGNPISVLVNNAGVHLKKPAVEITAEEFQTVLNTHVLVHTCSHAQCCRK